MPLSTARRDTTILVYGELDLATAPRLQRAIAEADAMVDTIDLRHLTFIDSSGIRALIVERRRHPNVMITNPSPQVCRLLEIVGAADLVLGPIPECALAASSVSDASVVGRDRPVILVVGDGCNAAPPRFLAMSHQSGWAIQFADGLEEVVNSCRAVWPTAAVVDTCQRDRLDTEHLLRWTRAEARIPSLTLTAPEDVGTRLLAIRLGVEDHAIAPVDSEELHARVAQLVRRATRQHTRVLGDLVVDRLTRRVTRRGSDVRLTPKELVLLDRLLATPGHVVTKGELLRAMGGAARTPNAVEVHVSSLRRKLEQAGPPILHTVHGQGYALRPVPKFDVDHRARLLETRERLIRQREEAMARRDRIVAQTEAKASERLTTKKPNITRAAGERQAAP